MSGCWKPYDHTYTGECEGQLVLPHYATMPDYIRVFDLAAKHFEKRWQRRAWRAVRAKSLYRWGFSDATMTFEEYRNTDEYPPEGVTLAVQGPGASSNNYGWFGKAPISDPISAEYDPLTWDQGKGAVLMHPTTVANAFLARTYGYLAGAMCHEFGHAFGFGHGGVGIMRSAVLPPYSPSTEERAAFGSYWGLGGVGSD